jgi:hypothetical protein
MLHDLAEAGKSLTTQQPGRLLRAGAEWSIDQEWAGAELTSYTIRFSAWTKTHVIRFYVAPPADVAGPAFSLHLAQDTPQELLEQQAEVWMTVLNARRIT